MRSTTVISFFIASWALASCEATNFLYGWNELNLFLEPAVFATPVPSPANSAGVKRFCKSYGCRLADTVRTFPYSWFISLTYFPSAFQHRHFPIWCAKLGWRVNERSPNLPSSGYTIECQYNCWFCYSRRYWSRTSTGCRCHVTPWCLDGFRLQVLPFLVLFLSRFTLQCDGFTFL